MPPALLGKLISIWLGLRPNVNQSHLMHLQTAMALSAQEILSLVGQDLSNSNHICVATAMHSLPTLVCSKEHRESPEMTHCSGKLRYEACQVNGTHRSSTLHPPFRD